MGGASGVTTGDTKEDVLQDARTFFEDASKHGLYPRDNFIYGQADVPVEYYNSQTKQYEIGYVILVDMESAQIPENAESNIPFPMYSNNLSDEDKKKRWFCFYSAHS